MSLTRSQRAMANCEIIWGKGDYDLDVETGDYINYMAFVKRDYGFSLGPPLAMTLCSSEDQAWAALERMLGLWAAHVRSGRPMTREQNLDIFGGPGGRN